MYIIYIIIFIYNYNYIKIVILMLLIIQKIRNCERASADICACIDESFTKCQIKQKVAADVPAQ